MKICKARGCNKKQKYLAKGYCCKHYSQYRKYGKILKRTRFDKNEIIDCKDYYEICLYSGLGGQKEIARTKIDREDLEKVKKYKWHFISSGYVANKSKKVLLMHRFILEAQKEKEVDHINSDKLDNRKCNLRLCNRSQNTVNRFKRKNCLTKYKGVYKRKEKFAVKIQKNGKIYYLGAYAKEDDAGRAYNKMALKLFGEFALLNKI